jgi:PAS domain S-box-containing protein
MATAVRENLADGLTIEELREQTDVPAVIFDQNGRVVFANQALEHCLAWKPDELLGLPVSTVLPNRFARIPAPELLPQRPIPATVRRRDGQRIDAELTVIAGNEGPALLYGALIRPLAEQRWFQYVPFEEESLTATVPA